MKIFKADARDLSVLDNEVAHLCVTSPPFWHNRMYGDDPREIGLGTLEQYVEDSVEVCRQVRDKLTPDGVLAWNVGDTRTGSGGAGGDFNPGGAHENKRKFKGSGRLSHLAPQQWAQVPQRVAIALQDEGWQLIVPIVWEKNKIRRGDNNFAYTRRPGLQTEMIYIFSKTRKYTFHVNELPEDGDVWHFANKISPLAKSSDAPFPDELPSRVIRLFSNPGDVVLDPFGGSYTSGRVAEELGRQAIMIDLYAEERREAVV